MPATTEHFSSGGRPVTADVYLPPTPGRHPAALVLHGTDGLLPPVGDAIQAFAEALAARGVVAVVAHYFERTGTPAGPPALAAIGTHLAAWGAACGDALQFARDHAAVDPRRLGVLGFSLGGHLALELAMARTNGTGLRCVVDFFGPTLLPPLRGDVAALPPVQIHHGTADPVVPIEQSAHLVEALRAAGRQEGVGYEFHRYRDQGHGFTDPELTTSRARAVSFLGANL